jgi:hypothetical protein
MRRACGSWAWYHPEKGLQRFYCGSGNCDRPWCRHLFWHSRVRLLSALVEQHGLIRFFTLTLDPKFVYGDPWAYVHTPWSRLRHRLKRRYPGWKFVAVLERHAKRDVPHIHGFTDVWMPQAEWTRHWQECKGGTVTWVEQVKTPEASEYVSKQLKVANYVGKNCVVPTYKAGKQYRTLWRSKGLKADFELTAEPGWCILRENVYTDRGELTWYGHDLEGRMHGSQAEQQRQDVEATRRAVSSEGTKAGVQDVEAEEPADGQAEGREAT